MRRSLLLLVAAALAPAAVAASSAASPTDDDSDSSEDITVEVQQALRYDRCQDALNMLLEEERSADTLSRTHRRLKAEAFICLGSYESALALYTDLIREEANNPQHRYRRARLYGVLGQPKKAYQDCARLRLLAPDDTTYCRRCGEYALGAKKYREAEAFLLRCAQDVEARYLLTLAHQGQKNLSQALLLINSCIADNPAEAACYAVRARLYEQTDAHRLAAGDYQTYLAKNPADHQAWLQYAHLLRKLGRTGEACKAFEQSEAHGNLDAGRYRYRYCR
ncbi:MAG: hypothetical protein LBH84_06005 [Prevotellaceae bacterium]|jgi:tetratricopeptide (TPR) repeat protein|nr:hypothetical protein [Prevotellaceae bacterium]